MLRAGVADRGRAVDGGGAAPGEAGGGLGVEVEAAHAALRFHDREQRSDRVDAEAEEGVADGAGGCDVGEDVREAPADDAQEGRVGAEDRDAEDHGGRVVGG